MSELEQTIEELEAEVLAELEEAEDPTKKGAAPAEGTAAEEGAEEKTDDKKSAKPAGKSDDKKSAKPGEDKGKAPSKKPEKK